MTRKLSHSQHERFSVVRSVHSAVLTRNLIRSRSIMEPKRGEQPVVRNHGNRQCNSIRDRSCRRRILMVGWILGYLY